MIYDQFTIYLRDECYDMEVKTSLTITDDENGNAVASDGSRFTKHMWQQQRYTITQVVYGNAGGDLVTDTSYTLDTSFDQTKCPTRYYITDINQERTENFNNDFTITGATNLAANDKDLDGIWDTETCGLFGCGVYDGYLWIRAVISNKADNEEVLVDEQPFWITISDPCIVPSSIVSPVKSDNITPGIDDLIYSINQGKVDSLASTINVSFLTDQASASYGYDQILTTNPTPNSQDNPYHICGPKTYEIYMED